jgi:plasmid stabilization system protein ParE
LTSVRFLRPAEEELLATVAYYNSRVPGLGAEFLGEVERTTALARERPMLGALFDAGVRRLLLRRFPYSLIYQAVADEVLVLAVSHQSRRPGYWRSRI